MSRAEDFSDNFLFKAKPLDAGYNRIISRGEKGLKHLEFGLLHLEYGRWSGETEDCEVVLDVHCGTVSVDITSRADSPVYSRIGRRTDVFDGLPTAVYLPPDATYTVTVVDGPAEIAVFSALAPNHRAKPVVVCPNDISPQSVGRDNWRRDVFPVVADDAAAAKLILMETLIPPGNWSSVPPGKHDAFNPPKEVPMEEVCYFRVSPTQGFGVIRIYTGPNDPGPMDEVYIIEDGDTAVIPRGYHIVGAAPGYSLHSTCVLAGDIRKPGAVAHDPRHAWIDGE